MKYYLVIFTLPSLEEWEEGIFAKSAKAALETVKMLFPMGSDFTICG